MKRYIQRDAAGKLIGHYANPQPGYAEEEVAHDHHEIVAWDTERKANAVQPKAALEQRFADLEARLAEAEAKLAEQGKK